MTTKTTWSKTIVNLGYNIVAGLEENKFFCPVFGTVHQLPEPTNDIQGQRNLRRFYYRGYTYYIKEIWHSKNNKYYNMFGLYVQPKHENDLPALCPIMMISCNIDHTIYFDTNGKVLKETGITSQTGL